jgi:hypothetical protein
MANFGALGNLRNACRTLNEPSTSALPQVLWCRSRLQSRWDEFETLKRKIDECIIPGLD